MPAIACPRCRRTNPNEAVFCHYDGAELRPAHGGARLAPNQLPHEFVFPSGRRCKTFDDLVQGCQYEWEEARGLLKDGVFTQYLSSIGRMDLCRSAQQAQTQADLDVGLHEFVGRLPAQQVQGPRLDLSPRRLALGSLRAGETRQSGREESGGAKTSNEQAHGTSFRRRRKNGILSGARRRRTRGSGYHAAGSFSQ